MKKMQCKSCGRGPCRTLHGRDTWPRCTNCYALRNRKLKRVCRLANRYCIEVGMCQVCRETAATVIWDTAAQTRVTTVDEGNDIYVWSRPFDLTAACVACVGDRGKPGTRGFARFLSLTEFGTLGEALPQYREWWQKCLAETIAQHDATPTPDSPTDYVPGSREKLDVLRQRYLAGQSLFHEEDHVGHAVRRWDGDHDEVDPLTHKYAVPPLAVVHRCREAVA